MRLRTRLALAFALLAVVPLALVVPRAIGEVRDILLKDLESRLDSARTVAEIVAREAGRDSLRAVEEIAGSAALEDFARELNAQGPSNQRLGAAERLMRERSLSVLSLFDADGKTLSSGHLPARVGDPDPALFAATQHGTQEALPVLVELRGEAGVQRLPALVAARPFDYGEQRIWVVGGRILDSQFADQLSRMTGARVEISDADGQVAAAGKEEPSPVETTLALEPAARIALKLSRAPVINTERVLLGTLIALIAFGLALAALLGILVARFITRPIDAVAEAATKIAAGAFDLKVPESSSGEVGELVRAFNRMTAELQSTTQQLVASERVAAWQEVARRLAHEIKNPLTPIKMSLETLVAARERRDPSFDQLFRDSAAAVQEEVERLRRIVDEFSQFARLPKPQLAPVNLSELAQQVLAFYAPPRDGVEIRSQITPRVWVCADRDQIAQLLLNLIKNAEEALAGAGWIDVRLKNTAGQAVLEVADSGKGIALEDQARIFEPYYTTKQGGSGLGLAIARRISQEHGGSLDVASAPGAGAVFRLTIPAASEPAASNRRADDREQAIP
jgi:two-component system, NtrC family, nitrogen regulation sensor histidine kinase NtrY